VFTCCDISGESKKDKYWVIGSVWIPKDKLPKYAEAVFTYRLKEKIWGELKWSYITSQKVDEYTKFITLSFKNFPLDIQVILLDKTVNKPKYYNNDLGKMFSATYYVLLKEQMKRLPTVTSLDIILDKESWIRDQSLNLKQFLGSSFIKRGLNQKINHLSQCDSKICPLSQLCDIITGAISAKWNQNLTYISADKKIVIKCIEDNLNHSLTEQTPPNTKFNLWIMRPYGISAKI